MEGLKSGGTVQGRERKGCGGEGGGRERKGTEGRKPYKVMGGRREVNGTVRIAAKVGNR